MLILFGLGFKENRGGNRGVTEQLAKIAHQLENIYMVLGGNLKYKEVSDKELADLRERYTKQLLLVKNTKTKTEIEKEVAELFESPDIEWHVELIEKWIVELQELARKRDKYGHLMDNARRFVESKSEVKEEDVEKGLNTEWVGARWLLEMLESEKKVERVLDYKGDSSPTIKYWKVIES